MDRFEEIRQLEEKKNHIGRMVFASLFIAFAPFLILAFSSYRLFLVYGNISIITFFMGLGATVFLLWRCNKLDQRLDDLMNPGRNRRPIWVEEG